MVSTDLARRFGGLGRLYGGATRQAFAGLHVVVAGIGGVGTWAAEALARSGVGTLTLVDMDHIAESNINRQAHALGSTLGQSKVHAMAARIHDINPHCRVFLLDDFVSADNIAGILALCAEESGCQAAGVSGLVAAAGLTHTTGSLKNCSLHVLLDCTDQVAAKLAMILQARTAGWPILVCGGAGGKTDPLALRAGDLALSTHDALLGRVRQTLRRHHAYPRGGASAGKPQKKPPRMGVHCLWFDQPVVLPSAWAQPEGVHDAPQGLSCAGYGSSVTITATMGMAAADWALRQGLRSV